MRITSDKQKTYTRECMNTLLILTKKMGSPSVISDHRIKFNHNFDWEEVKILDTEL